MSDRSGLLPVRLLLIALMIVLSLNASTVSGDDDPETPWPFEERCIAEPTLPPEDWTYSGTLLMAGYAGIHAMQADWDTSRVEAFFYADRLGKPLLGGQLSPDGRWYAVPIGEVFTTETSNELWTTNGLRLYSTADDTELNFR